MSAIHVTPPKATWDRAPVPSLVVEVVSASTRRRDHDQKKDLYMDAGVGEYWIVDPERRTITVVRPGEADRVERERVVWTPLGAPTNALLLKPTWSVVRLPFHPYAINDAGVIVGSFSGEAVRWENGTMTILPHATPTSVDPQEAIAIS